MQIYNSIEECFRLKTHQKLALKTLGLNHLRDLLYHFPHRFESPGELATSLDGIEEGKTTILKGVIKDIKIQKSFRKKIPMATGSLDTKDGNVTFYFLNQPYIAKKFPRGTKVILSGSLKKDRNKFVLFNPEIKEETFERFVNLPEKKANLPLKAIYKETKGISSLWIRTKIEEILKHIDELEDPIPENILKEYGLPSLKDSFIYAHFPRDLKDNESAMKRFSFEEIFLFSLQNLILRAKRNEDEVNPIEIDEAKGNKFIKERFQFTLTDSQKKVIKEIFADMEKAKPMARLLEGDVGSGKTAVAACAAYATITSKPKNQDFGTLQVAYMAPTEMLAKQQFYLLCELFNHLPISIGLITSKGCKKFPSKVSYEKETDISKAQLKKWVKNGEISAVVGTHSLLQKDVEFKHLSLMIIDEQHKFGVVQRKQLSDKSDTQPHLLSMTATPIPRTLALTIYGDLDISIIDELPPERKQVETKLLSNKNRDIAYKKIKEEVEKGRQAYVICPRIQIEGELPLHSVEEEFENLSENIFPQYEVGMVHGRMKKEEKNKTMQDFYEGKIQILVSTTVVEVGVNVENATTIVIENAERFGLTELHQLRGRVIRSFHKPYCFPINEAKSEISLERLKLFEKYSDGFLLAEKDLELRGTGELTGLNQSGVSDIAMEALKNVKLVEAAKKAAKQIVKENITLEKYPVLKEIIDRKVMYFE